MPVLMYERTDDGVTRSNVVTTWRTEFDGEEHRTIAEDLDEAIDDVLDSAVNLWFTNTAIDAQTELIRMWAIGRAVAEAKTLDHPAMVNEYRIHLWQAMEQKALLGIRSDGSVFTNWANLRSKSRPRTTRNDRHLFEVGLWMQQMPLDDCAVLFVGRASIASELFRRPAFRSLKMRSAFGRWISAHDDESLAWLKVKRNYLNLAKAVVKRWPARGPGSAKRPEHYTDKRLESELKRVLDPVVDAALARVGG